LSDLLDPVAASQNRAMNDARVVCASRRSRPASAARPWRSMRSARIRLALYHSALISTALPRLGVTTQSSTRASIQVSATPSAPAVIRPSVSSWIP